MQANPDTDVEHNASSSGLELDRDQERAQNDVRKDGLQKMGFEDSERPSVRSAGDRMGILVALVGLAIMLIYTWILIVASNPFSLSYFAFHPPFQILAIACFGYGILTLQPTTLAQPKAKAQGFARHQLFMLCLGFPCITIGSLAILYNKKVNEYAHFETWHGVLGITALAWMLVQIAIGGGTVWFGGRLFGRNPKALYKYHRASGYPLLVLFLLVVHLGGAWSSFAMKNMSLLSRFVVFLVAPAMVAFGIATRIRFDKMPIF